MKYSILSILLVCFLTGEPLNSFDDSFVDFDISLGKGSISYAHCMKHKPRFFRATDGKSITELLTFFRDLFEQYRLAHMKPSDQYKIPPIIHHIWLGRRFPEVFRLCRDTWHRLNPTWCYVLWVDNPENFVEGDIVVDTIGDLLAIINNDAYKGLSIVVDIRSIPWFNRDLYLNAPNYGEKSDILRYEILWYVGGVYADCDFECLKSFDILHRSYDLYAGIQPMDTGALWLNNALIGAKPNHPIIEDIIQSMHRNKDLIDTVDKTGPTFFTKSFVKLARNTHTINVSFPPTYFYPVRATKICYKRHQAEKLFRPESFAVHYWTNSWIYGDLKSVAIN